MENLIKENQMYKRLDVSNVSMSKTVFLKKFREIILIQSTNYKRADSIKVSPLLNAAGTRNVEKEFPASPS